jgi:hypothetical protein
MIRVKRLGSRSSPPTIPMATLGPTRFADFDDPCRTLIRLRLPGRLLDAVPCP